MDHKAFVKRVIDGDTFECTVFLDFCISLEITVRLLGVDTWELHGDQKELGFAARKFLKDMIESKEILITPQKKDSFGRWLCFAHYNSQDLTELMQIYKKKIIKSLV